jgi:hypothetical protein
MKHHHDDHVNASREHAKRETHAHPERGIIFALLAIDCTLLRIAEALESLRPAPGPSLGLTATAVRRTIMAKAAPLAIKDSENAQFRTSPADSAGNPTTPTLTWACSDESVLSLTPSSDTLSCLGTSLKTGVVNVTVTDGFVTDDIDVTIAVGGTVTLGLAGAPIAKA